MEKLYCGMDLHSNNTYCGISDGMEKRVFRYRFPNDLGTILSGLAPFRERLTGVAVESTYNWYWLVDGLQDAGYKVHLVNPNAVQQYDGLKNADDVSDAFHLAHLLCLGILPEGYIYPKTERPVRDLLRRRLLLVHQKTAQVLSLEGMMMRQFGERVTSRFVENLEEGGLDQRLSDPALCLAANTAISVIRHLAERIKIIEKEVSDCCKLKPEYLKLISIIGVGRILATTIMLETGPISRFATVSDYSSYCRCARADKTSNNKKKGENNGKNGNKYLSWAFVEAANYCRRYCEPARSFCQRKAAKRNNVLAIKALACKLSKAAYFIMRDQEVFQAKKCFG